MASTGLNLANLTPDNGAVKDLKRLIFLAVTDPESQDRHEATLHVYASIGGLDYELDLTNTPGEEIKPGEGGEVSSRFTLLQSL